MYTIFFICVFSKAENGIARMIVYLNESDNVDIAISRAYKCHFLLSVYV